MKYFDVHSHIFPDNIAGKVIHQLETYYGFTWQGTGELADLLNSMEEGNITRSVIFSSATKPSQVRAINDYIASLVRKYPKRFIGFGTMHPDYVDYRGELERIRELGLCGLKFHPDFQQFEVDAPRLMQIYEAAGENLTMLFHIGDKNTDYSSPRRMAHVVRMFPGHKLVAAHMGGYSEWEQAQEHLIGLPLYLDISSTIPHAGVDTARKMVLAHGVDRVLFASDYPAVRHKTAVQDVLRLGLSEAENEQIFYKNAENLTGIRAE